MTGVIFIATWEDEPNGKSFASNFQVGNCRHPMTFFRQRRPFTAAWSPEQTARPVPMTANGCCNDTTFGASAD